MFKIRKIDSYCRFSGFKLSICVTEPEPHRFEGTVCGSGSGSDASGSDTYVLMNKNGTNSKMYRYRYYFYYAARRSRIKMMWLRNNAVKLDLHRKIKN
jgi:hypothetical protein